MTSACVDMPGKHLETRAWGSGAAGPGDAHLGVIGTQLTFEATVLGDEDDDNDNSYRTLTVLSALHINSLNSHKKKIPR